MEKENNLNQNSESEHSKFRWCYSANPGDWSEWKTIKVCGGCDIINLWEGTNAGKLLFQVKIGQNNSYSAVISWSNPANHHLISTDNFVNKTAPSQVSLRVEWAGEVNNPCTFTLQVERVEQD